jgi:uncharacterized membrane protein
MWLCCQLIGRRCCCSYATSGQSSHTCEIYVASLPTYCLALIIAVHSPLQGNSNVAATSPTYCGIIATFPLPVGSCCLLNEAVRDQNVYYGVIAELRRHPRLVATFLLTYQMLRRHSQLIVLLLPHPHFPVGSCCSLNEAVRDQNL